MFLCFCLSVFLFVLVSVCPCFCLSLFLFVCLSVCLFVWVCLCFCLFTCQFVWLCVFVTVCLFISVCPSVCLLVCLAVKFLSQKCLVNYLDINFSETVKVCQSKFLKVNVFVCLFVSFTVCSLLTYSTTPLQDNYFSFIMDGKLSTIYSAGCLDSSGTDTSGNYL